jgi:hypothetical protein
MRLKLLSAGVIAGIVAMTSASQGAVIAQYGFGTEGNPSATPPTTTTFTLAATTLDANATATSLTKGASVNAITNTDDYYASKPLISLSRSNDTAAQVYFQVTLTAAAGFELNMDSFSFDGAKGGTSDPRTYEVHSSVGGLAISSDLNTPGQVLTSGSFAVSRGAAGSTDTLPTITADLSAPAYDHLSSLTMRVFFYTPTTNQNIDIDNWTFNGSVVPVPEPATLSAGLVLAAGTLVRRRRRQ